MKTLPTSIISARLDLARAQLDVVTAEVWASVSARADESMSAARREAEDFRTIAKQARDLMGIRFEDIAIGPDFPTLLRTVDRLIETSGPFAESFQAFVKEHAVVLDEDSRNTIDAFLKWTASLPSRLAPLAAKWVHDLEAGLASAREAQSKLAEEWSGTDEDGLD